MTVNDSAAPSAASRSIRSVCVYCGSQNGSNPRFAEAARALGEGLAHRGLRLVYGAGDMGLMGECARACVVAGGRTLGVVPRNMFEREIGDRRRADVIVTENMHHRKSVMLWNADAVMVLPGGFGTLDELIEAITWRQLGLHDKAIILLDVDSFWAPLRTLFSHMRQQSFLYGGVEDQLVFAQTVAEALDEVSIDSAT